TLRPAPRAHPNHQFGATRGRPAATAAWRRAIDAPYPRASHVLAPGPDRERNVMGRGIQPDPAGAFPEGPRQDIHRSAPLGPCKRAAWIAGTTRIVPPPMLADRPIWCNCAAARPDPARCEPNRPKAGVDRHRPARWRQTSRLARD